MCMNDQLLKDSRSGMILMRCDTGGLVEVLPGPCAGVANGDVNCAGERMALIDELSTTHDRPIKRIASS